VFEEESVQRCCVEVEGLCFDDRSCGGAVFEEGAQFASDEVVGVCEARCYEGAGFGEAEGLLLLLVLMLMMMLFWRLLLRVVGRVEEGVIDFVPEFAGEGEVVHYYFVVLFLMMMLVFARVGRLVGMSCSEILGCWNMLCMLNVDDTQMRISKRNRQAMMN
jgi:hypothetical protein